jgi:prepilin-type processing-associated H-X9-DG protein
MSNNASVGNRAAIDDGADDALSGATHTWWSVLRKVMRGGKGNWDNSVQNTDGSRSTRFMAAFNCPTGNNRDAGCDFGTNPVIMPDLRFEIATGPHAASPAFRGRRLTRPATSKSLFGDNVVMFDAAELSFGSEPFSRQYVTAYDLDGGRLMQPNTTIGAQMRFRGLVASGNAQDDGSLADPGPNVESDGATTGQIGQLRWRHGKNDTANFLFGDSSVRPMRITTNFATAQVRGELTRGMLRPKPYPGYRIN